MSKAMADSTRRVYAIAQRSLKRAQDAYAQRFAHPINDPSINEELERLVVGAIEEGNDVVEMPAHLALALWLRSGGRGRGRRPQGTWERRFNDLAVRVARRIKNGLVADGMQPGTAGEKAAAQAKEKVYCRISAATILDRMNRDKAGTRSGK